MKAVILAGGLGFRDEPYAQHCGVMLRSLFANNPRSRFSIHLLTNALGSVFVKATATVSLSSK